MCGGRPYDYNQVAAYMYAAGLYEWNIFIVVVANFLNCTFGTTNLVK